MRFSLSAYFLLSAYSVTAPAIASSRQRFRVRKSSVLNRRSKLDRKVRDGLANIAVVVNDLAN